MAEVLVRIHLMEWVVSSIFLEQIIFRSYSEWSRYVLNAVEEGVNVHIQHFSQQSEFISWMPNILVYFLHLRVGGYIFISVCLCVCVCVCLCVRISCEQNSSWTDAPIWTRVLLNGCLVHWLKHYWNWWPWVKDRGHSG